MSEQIVERIGDLLSSQRKTLACAESCTGGGISFALTSVPGSSHWFERGYVSYSNLAKAQMLGVDEALIVNHGAVSEAVVQAMVEGTLEKAGSDYALAISGIAGPDGGSQGKPVGTVCIGWGSHDQISVLTYLFKGNRKEIRDQAITQSLLNIYQFAKNRENTV